MKLSDLKNPLPSIHWRSQSITKDGNSALALAYIDARDVMDKLDSVCSPENWQDSYSETPKGRIICTISIRIGDQWVSKSDGAGDTAVEGEKGALSDALKRAGVKWGIGRYLYDMPATWAECTSYERGGKKVFKAWTNKGLETLRRIEATVAPPLDPKDAPISVTAMLEGLRDAIKSGDAADYWQANFKAVPDNWKPYVNTQKEKMKENA